MERQPVLILLYSTITRLFLSDIKLTEAGQNRAAHIWFAYSGALRYTIRRRPARIGRLWPAGEEAGVPRSPRLSTDLPILA